MRGGATSTQAILSDQFGTTTVFVGAPRQVCNPVDKNGEGLQHPENHLVCYEITTSDGGSTWDRVDTSNQFGDRTLRMIRPQSLCVPSTKTVIGGD